MKEGAIAEVIESQPIATAKPLRARAVEARRHARTDRIGPRRRNGLLRLVRSEMRPRMTAATPAASEKRKNRRPSSNEFVVKRNEPSGVATDKRPSTPPWPAKAATALGCGA